MKLVCDFTASCGSCWIRCKNVCRKHRSTHQASLGKDSLFGGGSSLKGILKAMTDGHREQVS